MSWLDVRYLCSWGCGHEEIMGPVNAPYTIDLGEPWYECPYCEGQLRSPSSNASTVVPAYATPHLGHIPQESFQAESWASTSPFQPQGQEYWAPPQEPSGDLRFSPQLQGRWHQQPSRDHYRFPQRSSPLLEYQTADRPSFPHHHPLIPQFQQYTPTTGFFRPELEPHQQYPADSEQYQVGHQLISEQPWEHLRQESGLQSMAELSVPQAPRQAFHSPRPAGNTPSSYHHRRRSTDRRVERHMIREQARLNRQAAAHLLAEQRRVIQRVEAESRQGIQRRPGHRATFSGELVQSVGRWTADRRTRLHQQPSEGPVGDFSEERGEQLNEGEEREQPQ